MLGTIAGFVLGGIASRGLALGILGKPMTEGAGVSAAWITGWAAAGLSYAEWKERQEKAYIERLQYLVDRKERRDKWDAIYFGEK